MTLGPREVILDASGFDTFEEAVSIRSINNLKDNRVQKLPTCRLRRKGLQFFFFCKEHISSH